MVDKTESIEIGKLKNYKNSSKRFLENKEEKKTSRFALISFIFALLGTLLFFSCLYQIVSLRSTYRLVQIICGLIFASSFTLATISLGVVAFNRKTLKVSLFAIASLFICGLLLFMWIPFRTSLIRHERGVTSSKLEKLYRSITAYCTNHNGYLPDAGRWCDLLIEYDKNLSKDNFRYPPGKHGIFLFAFNKNLDGLRLDEIPNDVVLLFEHDGSLDLDNEIGASWNLSGGPELLEKRFKERKRFFVLLANGRVYQSIPSLRELFKEKMELRWKP